MYKENRFLKIVTYGPLIFIPLIIIAILLVSMQIYNENFQSNLKKDEQHLYDIEKKAVINKVQNISDIITYKKSIIKEELTSRVQNRVKSAFTQAHNIYEQNKEIKTKQDIQKMIKDALRPLVWNNGESFIWIIDYDGILELAPNYLQDLENYSIINFQDVTSRFTIKEEIAIAKNKGEGFLWDTFTKPNDPTKKHYKQVAYIKSFGDYNWYLGSAEYLDTATKKMNKILMGAIKEIDKMDNHYIFLITTKGDILINKSIPQIVGKNIFETDQIKEKAVIEKLINSVKAQNSNNVTYKWLNPSTNNIEYKFSYIQKVPDTDWIIGSGFYLSDIENKLSKERISAYELFYTKSKDFFYLILLIVAFALLTSYYISRKLKGSFTNYERNIDAQNTQLMELNNTLELKVQERTSQLKQMKDNLEILAETDSLTKLHNRYSLMKILESEINRSNRYKIPLSIIMFDIDFFKKVNDTYGHDIGDNVLRKLSTVVKEKLREIDTIGRYGGEEFLIIQPNTKLTDARKFADRIREDVETHLFDTAGNITISIGLVELKEDETIDEVFKRVDDMLYYSKDSGRNKVSF